MIASKEKSEKENKSPLVAVDGLIIKDKKVLLLKRAIFPYKNYWILPGGHVKYGEKVEEALKREIKEETGLDVKIKKLIGVFSDPKRDPRGHIISIAFLVEPIKDEKIKTNFEAKEGKFFELENLPKKIGFDHREIIYEYIKKKRK